MHAKCLLLALLVPAASSGVDAAAQVAAVGPRVGSPLPAWTRGELDIHHINTGRGEAQLLIMPDGTSLLVDTSGKTVEKPPFSLPTRPDASRPPGEWVARYVQRVLPAGAAQIDYALITHFHGDHMGAIVEDSPHSEIGPYRRSGITEIADLIPVARVIDRDWPDYDYPRRIENPTMDNYRRFLAWQVANRGLTVQRFLPGRRDQLVPVHAADAYPQFSIRNIAANGVVWDGTENGTRHVFPPLEDLAPDDHPIENNLSIAFKVSYGRFDYFTGGDLSSHDEETTFGQEAWKDIETPVARATGPVDAMKANHHGSWDANSTAFLGTLRPRVIVVGSRAEGHPAVNTYRRMTSKGIWNGPRDIFVTNVSEATAKTTYGVEHAASTQGHVVIRVAEGGESYRVYVLDDADEERRIKAVFGPYDSD
ncbi:hypothetical protein LDO26_05800 [Luteimonas sp. BDR2-5]|uniref:ComEC/Rec2 family competence protein n=1 Tax=Proluteimonas luteida TaxID=2878685 RepID=UPI001E49E78F|nr:hypothetical protein [Luteimonas sp. BDR2-5]MCD9027718.1 hypothetical protein [Luteimonas sp. BDR2-5]